MLPAPGPDSDTFRYVCAQREGEQTKNKLTNKPNANRDRSYMNRFECGGELRITTHEHDRDSARVVITHTIHHIPYCDISIPDEIKALIERE